MNLSKVLNLALDLSRHGQHPAAVYLMATATPKTLEDVRFLVDIASDFTPRDSGVSDGLDDFDEAADAGNHERMKDSLLAALWWAREDNEIIAECLLWQAVIYFDASLCGFAPNVDWFQLYPEVRGVAITVLKLGA